ncbi:MAG: hypothetical protein AAGF74_15145 [Pseudomonadota bacterium]
MILITYFSLAFALLIALAAMVLQIGKALGECPDTGRTARTAATTITTGFVTMGAGGVILAALLISQGEPAQTLLIALGLVCVVLGLGFTQAVATLRAVVDDAVTQPPEPPQSEAEAS